MRRPFVLVMALCGTAAGEHDHSHHHDEPGGAVIASASVLAATYDQLLFDGDYQGIAGSVVYARGRVVVGASGSAYRVQKNGLVVHGPGDMMLHAQVNLTPAAGLVAAVMLPTGSDDDGLGMGHAMLMPAAFAQLARPRFLLRATVGVGQGLGDEAVHAEHGGMWPIVEPMNYRELTCSGSAMLVLAPQLRAGVRASGAVPLGDGAERLTAGVGAIWTAGRAETAFEVSTGLAGDPYLFHGRLATSLRF